MNTRDWQEIIGVIGVFLLLTTVITVTIWQLAATWRARAALAREQEYQRLAATAISAQTSMTLQITQLNDHLAEVRARLDSVERLLAETE
ncbi:MAG TPA: hypothetical protein VGT61_13150 [Thermomicrobiales bacterium]|jgi:Tfp pilus assembly protein PilO|nr:hypothetical protein [Thermomicrobiales bacterium]